MTSARSSATIIRIRLHATCTVHLRSVRARAAQLRCDSVGPLAASVTYGLRSAAANCELAAQQARRVCFRRQVAPKWRRIEQQERGLLCSVCVVQLVSRALVDMPIGRATRLRLSTALPIGLSERSCGPLLAEFSHRPSEAAAKIASRQALNLE